MPLDYRMRPRTVEAAIKRLTREIEEIDSFFYKTNENADRVLYDGMLERKRDDMVHSAVLQLHTSIEDLLNVLIIFCITTSPTKTTGTPRRFHRFPRSPSARALRKMLYGGGSIGFEMKLNFALALRIINDKTKHRLLVLNTLRNKCSHNWVLKVNVRHGKRPAQKKPPLLLYESIDPKTGQQVRRDLHSVSTLKDFVDEYTLIYLRLYMKTP